jgi:type IV pilus assembly protein PilX
MKNMISKPSFYSQQGVLLIVALVFLLLLSIIGMAAIRSSGMQELMAGNIKDRNMAFQGAEASLRVAEELINSNSVCSVVGTAPCFNDQNTIAPVINWSETDWKNNSVEANVELSLSKKPRYVIEKLGPTDGPVSANAGFSIEFNNDAPSATGGVSAYRVTSLGYGGTDTSQVVLQSTYRHKDP